MLERFLKNAEESSLSVASLQYNVNLIPHTYQTSGSASIQMWETPSRKRLHSCAISSIDLSGTMEPWQTNQQIAAWTKSRQSSLTSAQIFSRQNNPNCLFPVPTLTQVSTGFHGKTLRCVRCQNQQSRTFILLQPWRGACQAPGVEQELSWCWTQKKCTYNHTNDHKC